VKFVLDALNKHAYKDDSQIVVLTSAKLYSEGKARTTIHFRKIEDDVGRNTSRA